MKHIHKILMLIAFPLLLAACADNTPLDYSVEKPESIAIAEYLNNYDVLKAYVNRTENPNFKLGAGVNLSDYVKKGIVFQLINSNFDEIAIGYQMKHGAVVKDNGTIDLANVLQLIEVAKEAGTSVYGHTLVWHANQNAKYLNSLLAPTVIPGQGGPTWEEIAKQDFETDNASNYQYNNNAVVSFTAAGQGAAGTGRAIKITNTEVRANEWDVQFFVTFAPPMEAGEKYILRMDVRSDAPATFATQAHTVPYAYKHWDLFGSISSTPTWSEFVKEITVSADVATTGTIAFNLGMTATSYYFDNIRLEKFNEKGGGGPSLDPSVITNSDFEAGTGGWGGWGGSSTRGQSPAGQGADGVGHSYWFTNPTAGNYWGAQVAYDISPALELNSAYKLDLKVKASTAGTIRAELQSSSDYSSNSFGTFNLTTEWKEISLETTATKDDRNRFVISFGDYVGTVYIDDVTLRRVNPDGGGDIIIEKTAAEKTAIVDAELERWMKEMLGATKGYVKAWDVVNEPMSDWPDPSKLKTGIGKTDIKADEFYWQDYLGKDYAVRAIQLARQYGNPDDILFINDYGLEGENQAKVLGLIEYVKYVESKGVKVDGIGTQMHVTYGITSLDAVKAMFKNLAATGKLIKVSELDMGYRVAGAAENLKTDQLTVEQHKEMAKFYQDIVQAYFENIPAPQRYGITQWAATDSPAESSWRSNEPIGLWSLNYNRKHAYGGFANGLAGKVLFTPSN